MSAMWHEHPKITGMPVFISFNSIPPITLIFKELLQKHHQCHLTLYDRDFQDSAAPVKVLFHGPTE
jgi:hypothetical protein